ncbi:MAG TPA: hypothetical protein DDW51_10915 [Cyanobacteria bacterium UBA11367]|nr:hypothetical protein [Cyanobacteria bacterium UBA11367]HBS68172.1 hypothetical protein [Cyanobacteria bacterium UBA11153]
MKLPRENTRKYIDIPCGLAVTLAITLVTAVGYYLNYLKYPVNLEGKSFGTFRQEISQYLCFRLCHEKEQPQ